MKLCHFSDSHLGAGENHPRRGASGLTERQEDAIRSFTEAVDRIIEIRPDLCIHSGDLFHAVRPLNRLMAIAAEQLHRLASLADIPTVIISGNHDTPRQPYVGAPLEVLSQIDNLYVAACGKLEVFQILGGKVFALPHCLSTTDLAAELARCEPDSSAAFNVLVMHGVAAGMPEFSMADLGEQEIPLDVMDRFDYTALGHYHNFRQVTDRAWYAGSTERLSQAERDAAKGFAVVNLQPLQVTMHEVHAREMVLLDEIDAGSMRGDELARLMRVRIEQGASSDKIVKLKVTNVAPETLNTLPVEELAALKEKYFAVDISFEKAPGADESLQFGRSAIGRLDQAFVDYLEQTDLGAFDRERLLDLALQYLRSEE